jgi:hypothetical protein
MGDNMKERRDLKSSWQDAEWKYRQARSFWENIAYRWRWLRYNLKRLLGGDW